MMNHRVVRECQVLSSDPLCLSLLPASDACPPAAGKHGLVRTMSRDAPAGERSATGRVTSRRIHMVGELGMAKKKAVEKVQRRGKARRAPRTRPLRPKRAKAARVEAQEVTQRTVGLAPSIEHKVDQAIANDGVLSAERTDVYRQAMAAAFEVCQAMFALSLQGLRTWQTAWSPGGGLVRSPNAWWLSDLSSAAYPRRRLTHE